MGTIPKNIQTEGGYNLCCIRGPITELSVKIKMFVGRQRMRGFNVSVKVKKKKKARRIDLEDRQRSQERYG